MTEAAGGIELSRQDLREVTGFAAICAEAVLEMFEAERPDDPRPREAIATAWEFARGGERGKALRDTAWAALKAARTTDTEAAREAARAAMSAAGAAYLHPLAKDTQVKHILGAAAHAARAAELAAGDAGSGGRRGGGRGGRGGEPGRGGGSARLAEPERLAGAEDVGVTHVRRAARHVTPVVVEVLKRFPAAPSGGGRVGELTRVLDADLRG